MCGVVYPPLEAILVAHQRMIERYGGAVCVRNPGGVEAALARAQQIEAYAETAPSLFTLAAAIGFGFARIHHPFVDGNKRVAFYATFATLWLNGWRLDVAEQDAAAMVERVAAGEVEEDEFARWLESGCLRR
ncbi:MAG: type II toxin-antitoxin system death-on-curing family toxin [Geminicoccaceae bacterium]